MYKKGTLEQSRIDRLNAIGFEYEVAKSDMINFSVVWDKSFQELKNFREMNGHVEVPENYKPTPEWSTNLDGWITRQRKHFKSGKLPDHLIAKLRSIGIILGGRGRPFGIETDESWMAKYDELLDYSAEHGDADIPERYEKNKELAKWAKIQRQQHSKGELPDDRFEKLMSAGFNFYRSRKSQGARDPDPWMRRLSELRAYKEKTGSTNVPRKFTLNLGLGDFVYNQKMVSCWRLLLSIYVCHWLYYPHHGMNCLNFCTGIQARKYCGR